MTLLTLVAFLPFMTWAERFFQVYEHDAIYPFDSHYAPAANAGVPGLAETRLRTADGTELVLWLRPADAGRPTLLYLPGNASNLLGRAPRFRDLAAQGYGLVALSWRGQGGSGGRADEALLVADGLAVFDRYEGLDPVLYGESLGSAVAVRIAAQRPARGLVLESPFTSIPDLAAVQYPGEALRPLITQIWDSLSVMGRVDEPLLVLHGTEDRLVPVAQGERIFAAAASADKTMVELDHQGHDGIWVAAGQKAIYAFLDRLPPQGGP